MPDIQIQVNDNRYKDHIKNIRSFCKRIIRFAWQSQEPAEISLVLADDAFVWQLNKQYRGKDMPTNVLSFETGNPPPPESKIPWLAGDIIVAYETVLKEAEALGQSFESHLAHLLIHGTLHLQGYDHLVLEEAHEMEALETKLMQALGYDDPYRNLED